LATDDAVWNHSVLSKNRDRLIEHDAVTALSAHTVQMATERGLLLGEHFNVDGTLIQAWVGHKTVRRKDGADDQRRPRTGAVSAAATRRTNRRPIRTAGCAAEAMRRPPSSATRTYAERQPPWAGGGCGGQHR
jgi:hypothetical protein